MDPELVSYIGDLNKVFLYLNLDEYNIDGCYYHSRKLKISHNLMLTTRCSITLDTLMYLFGANYGKQIEQISDACVVEIDSDYDSLTHIFLYLQGYMYHSYAGEFAMKCVRISKNEISKRLNNFIIHPNWEKITEIKEPIPNDTVFEVTIHEIENYTPQLAKCKAITLVENALHSLKENDKHQYDDYLYILSLDRECHGMNYIECGDKYLSDLLNDLETL